MSEQLLEREPARSSGRRDLAQNLPSWREFTSGKALPALLIVIGLLVIIYPVVSTQWNNWLQQEASREFAQLEKDIPEEVLDKAWREAHRYNEERVYGPILDPWLQKFIPDNPDYREYQGLLAEHSAMARLVIPSIKVDLPVYHGTEDDTLQKGVGHLFGSHLPVGGEGTHSVLTAHTGLANATLFDNLKDVKEGDVFFVQVAGHKLKYSVDQIKVILPHEIDAISPEAGKDFITLVTCTPYGINTHRLLVRGQQVPITEEDQAVLDEPQGLVWQWWMYLLLAMFLAGLAGLGWWLIRLRKKQSDSAELNQGDAGAAGAEDDIAFDDAGEEYLGGGQR